MPIKLGNSDLVSGLQWYPESTIYNLQSRRRICLTHSQQRKKNCPLMNPLILLPDPWLYFKENALLRIRMIWPWDKMISISTKCQLDLLKWKTTIKVLCLRQIRELSNDKTDTMGKDSALTMAGPEEDIKASRAPMTWGGWTFQSEKREGSKLRTFQSGESQSGFLFPCSHGHLCDLGMPFFLLVIVQLGWIVI